MLTNLTKAAVSIEISDNLIPQKEVSGLFRAIPKSYAIVLTVALIVFSTYWSLTTTDVPHIKGLPEFPGAVPAFGHLLKLGEDHASVCEKWWREKGHSVFQIKLGNTRAVVVNSFEDCRAFLVTHSNAIIDRPKLYTFHGLVSSTQGFTIGSSPWDQSCKKKRQALGKSLSRPAIKSYCHPMFDLESYAVVRDLHRDSKNGELELSIYPYIQKYAMNTELTLCYGIRMDAVYDDLLREILEVGTAISHLRSTSENLQDYIPILRYVPSTKNSNSKGLRERRDQYLDKLLSKTRSMIDQGTEKPCVAVSLYKDEETKLTEEEISSICLSLISGGFETVGGTLICCLGSLATSEGQVWQDRAYEDIKRQYPDMQTVWTKSIEEEKVPYVNALIKETFRYYTISAFGLPRKTASEINWNGAIIPAGTMVLVNAQSGNHDVDKFGPTARKFDPERWLKSLDPPTERETRGLPHLSFGAGSRACSGAIISPRLLYCVLVRLLASYKIVASESDPPNTDYVEYNDHKSALVAVPKDYKVRLIPRDDAATVECLETARVRTYDYYRE